MQSFVPRPLAAPARRHALPRRGSAAAALALSALTLAAAPRAQALEVSDNLQKAVYSIDLDYGLGVRLSGGVLRLGSKDLVDASLNGRPLTRMVLGETEAFFELIFFRSGIRFRQTFRATQRLDVNTLAGQAEICARRSNLPERCSRPNFIAVRTNREDRREPSEQGLERVGETTLDLPGQRSAASLGSGGSGAGYHVLEGGEGHEGHEEHEHSGGLFVAGPPAVNVRVAGNLAYVARYEYGLVIVDISDLRHPLPIGRLPTTEPIEIYNDVKLTPDGRHVLVASSTRGMVSIDVSDPYHPVEVARFPASGRTDVHTLFVEGTRAYLADITGGGIRIVDVTEPAQPIGLGQFLLNLNVPPPDRYFVHDLMVRDGIAYLNAWNLGLLVVDCNDPALPFQVGHFTYPRMTSHSSWVGEIGGRLIALNGDEDFDAHLRVLDVTEPAHITQLSEWQTRPGVSIHNVMLLGQRAYIAHYQDGVRVLDLSDPRRPREVAHYNTWKFGARTGFDFFEGAVGIDVDLGRGLIFVADTHRGLIILRQTL